MMQHAKHLDWLAFIDDGKGLLTQLFQEELKKALEFYLVKYPQKSKIFLSNEMNKIVKEINESSLLKNCILNRLGISFRQDSGSKDDAKGEGSKDFSRKIKELFN